MKKGVYSLEQLISGLKDKKTFKFKLSGSVFANENDKLVDTLTEMKEKISRLEGTMYQFKL